MQIQKIQKMQKTQGLGKLASFIEYHQINFQQIWASISSLSVHQFVQIMTNQFGYTFTEQQNRCLKQLGGKSEKLTIQSFHEIGLWSDKSCQSHYTKLRKNKQNLRPQTAKESRVQAISTLNQSKPASKYVCNQSLNQSSMNYLTKNSRFKQNNQQLQKKIVENALDKKWQYLIKVGQMNSWEKSVVKVGKESTKKQIITSQVDTEPSNNRVYKIQDDDQQLKIIEYKQNGATEVLPLKVFDQKYQLNKKKHVNEEKTKNNMKGTMLLVLDKKDKVSKTKLCQKISQRDQQLNYLLLQIVRLKEIFSQQQEILTQCGVNS